MRFEVPQVMREEHRSLHAELVRASKEPGAIGAAAAEVVRLLKPHTQKEETLGLPPLGLLARLARGDLDNDMGEVLELTERLKTELPVMLEEHQAIFTALQALITAARKHDRVDLAEFAQRLVHHARLEEEILYPASLLVGEVVALRLGLKGGTIRASKPARR
jgi:hypothetical protein